MPEKNHRILFAKWWKNPPLTSPWQWNQNLCVHQVSSSKNTCMQLTTKCKATKCAYLLCCYNTSCKDNLKGTVDIYCHAP